MLDKDYLLVNSTNEFLEEYTDLSENARYKLTNFSGSTGDALLTRKGEIFLFVDGRYHAQADLEVDHNNVKVVKLQVGDNFIVKLFDYIDKESTLTVVSKKISQARLESLRNLAQIKDVRIELIDEDLILPDSNNNYTDESIDVDLGLSINEKIEIVTKNLGINDAIFTANQEEISYLMNKRDFSKKYSSSVKRKKILIMKDGIHDINYPVCGVVFADKSTTNAYDYKKINAIPLFVNPIKQMKAIKTKDEIKHLKSCFKKADKALLATKKYIENNENISEFDVAQELEKNFYKNGAKGLSFKPIVAKDKNSAQAHYSKSSKDEIITEGSLVLIDCGAYFDGGLATDATRVFVKGEPTNLQKEVYTKVLKAFLNAISLTEFKTGFDVDKIARDMLNEIKPEGFEFSHSLGHGIGIGVHENPPSLSPSDLGKTELKEGMCFSIEPGLYNPEYFGVRLENTCYLDKKHQIQSLSNMCFEEKLIDYSLLNETEKEVLAQWI